MKLENKKFELLDWEVKTQGDGGPGMIAGYGAVKGNVDSYGDIIVDGAFRNLAELKSSGALLAHHNAYANPIGFFVEAREDAKGLYIEAQFHDTEEGQELRKIVQERKAAGKTVGLSIGYYTTDFSDEVKDGKNVRLLKGIDVHEVSLVTFPANKQAQVVGVKGSGTQLETHVESVLASVEDLTDRFADLAEKRGTLNDLNKSRVASLITKLSDLSAVADTTVDPPVVEEEFRDLTAEEEAEIEAMVAKLRAEEARN